MGIKKSVKATAANYRDNIYHLKIMFIAGYSSEHIQKELHLCCY